MPASAIPHGPAIGRTLTTLPGRHVHIAGDGVYGPTSVYLARPGHPTECVGHLGLYADGWGAMVYSRTDPARFQTRELAARHALTLFVV
jgi:hypothetical protein